MSQILEHEVPTITLKVIRRTPPITGRIYLNENSPAIVYDYDQKDGVLEPGRIIEISTRSIMLNAVLDNPSRVSSGIGVVQYGRFWYLLTGGSFEFAD